MIILIFSFWDSWVQTLGLQSCTPELQIEALKCNRNVDDNFGKRITLWEKWYFHFFFCQKVWVQTWLCNLCRSGKCKLGRDNGDGTRSSGEQTRWGRQWKTQFELDWQRRGKMRKIFGRRTILVCWRGRDREEKENWQLKTQFVQWRCCCSCGENMWNLKSQKSFLF